jgi:hypothetical protein
LLDDKHTPQFPASLLLSIKMGAHKCFLPGWPGTMILLISASCIACDDRCESTVPSFIQILNFFSSLQASLVNNSN